jgi:hypothetical protein
VFRFQFGLPFVGPDCLARFDRLVHLELRHGCSRGTLPRPTDIGKVEPRVGRADIGFGEAEFAAHDINEFSLGPTCSSHPRSPAPTEFRPPFAKQTDEILPNFGYERSEIAALRGGKVI